MSNLSKIRIKDANGVEKEHNIVDSRVGNLTELTTANKENLVNAINEVESNIENKASKDLSNVTNEDFLNKCSVAGIADASTKMDKDNPVGTGSLSIDRKSGTTIGKNSVALGKDCVAAGDYSLSMGYQNTVNAHYASAEGESNTIGTYGYCSHVEGWNNTVTGRNSHAEGYGNKATNSYTHAEGNQVIASGESSHAEGYETTASGEAAHVEGRYSKAQKISAHAEGCFTIADSPDQHTEGRYNKIDSESIYAHIVGNGTNDSNRSNAYTLDWDGNGVYSGKVSVGANVTPTENNDLATKKYVDDNSTIKAVDCTRAEYDAMEYHDPNTYYNIIDEDNGLATHEADGLMSAEDKTKLDNMSGGDNTINGIPVDLTGIYNTQVIGYDETQGKLVPMINVARTETVVPNAIIPAPWNVEIISNTGGTLQGDPKTFGVTGATGAWSCRAEFTTAYLLSEFTNVHIDSLTNKTFFQIDFSKTADFKNIEASYLTTDKSGNCDITHLIGVYYMRVTISNSTNYDATVSNLYFSQGG